MQPWLKLAALVLVVAALGLPVNDLFRYALLVIATVLVVAGRVSARVAPWIAALAVVGACVLGQILFAAPRIEEGHNVFLIDDAGDGPSVHSRDSGNPGAAARDPGSPQRGPRDSKSAFTRVCDALCVAGCPSRGRQSRRADQPDFVSRPPLSSRRPSSHLSTHIAMPMPPPMQSVARPFFALRFCIS